MEEDLNALAGRENGLDTGVVVSDVDSRLGRSGGG
jgi:hypothetical protein